jgi:hypothetical protein
VRFSRLYADLLVLAVSCFSYVCMYVLALLHFVVYCNDQLFFSLFGHFVCACLLSLQVSAYIRYYEYMHDMISVTDKSKHAKRIVDSRHEYRNMDYRV